jgi:hypothetical protein
VDVLLGKLSITAVDALITKQITMKAAGLSDGQVKAACK